MKHGGRWLMRSAAQRIAAVLLPVALLWLAVLWALAGSGGAA